MYSWEDIARKIRKTKKQLFFALYCLPHGDDQRFVDSVKRIGKEYNVVSVEKGEENGGISMVFILPWNRPAPAFLRILISCWLISILPIKWLSFPWWNFLSSLDMRSPIQ